VKNSNKYFLIIALIILFGGFLRVDELSRRPMHTDESVNAIKFGRLLENGEYIYDKVEYHGPIIQYISLVPAFIDRVTKLKDLNEEHLRIIPAIAGIGLLLLIVLLKPYINWKTVVSIVLIGAISPALVFYSRYYIHEILLVFFTYGFIISCFLFIKQGKLYWLIISGLFLGLMHTTKETFLISVGVFILAIICLNILWKDNDFDYRRLLRTYKWHHYLLLLGIAGSISVVFFSSFFKNPQGIIDSITTYENYISKAGRSELHDHPWYYYLQILGWNKGPGYMIWSELPVLILAFYGIYVVSIRKKISTDLQFFRLIAIFSIALFCLYSILPYKTPWNIISAYFGLVIMAGYGLKELSVRLKNRSQMLFLVIFISGMGVFLLIQVVYSNYKYPAHPSNPYVYGHTGMDIFHMTDRIKKVTGFHPDGKDLYIQVIASGSDYWPLPWYLRKFNNVGWWDHVDFNTPLAPVIIVSPDQEKSLIRKMYELPKPGQKYLYIPLFDEHWELRPGIKLHGFVRRDHWGF
jgi:uncharacterized protein (TIGR03663 family)